MNKLTASIASTLMFALAGCGGTGGPGNELGAVASSDVGGMTADWNATDACSLLDEAALGAALHDNVTETSLALVHEASGAEAATSECTYLLAGGGRASLMARNSPIADNTPDAIALARKTTEQTMSAFSTKKIEDVPELGKAAFFVPSINQLNVFLDDRRFVILTIGTAPDATAKATAVDLVRKIET